MLMGMVDMSAPTHFPFVDGHLLLIFGLFLVGGLRHLLPLSSCIDAVGFSSSAFAGAVGGGSSNMLRFYTHDSLSLNISPTVILVMSLCFIAFISTLHVCGKLYRKKVDPGA